MTLLDSYSTEEDLTSGSANCSDKNKTTRKVKSNHLIQKIMEHLLYIISNSF